MSKLQDNTRNNAINRRDFLKFSGITLGAATLGMTNLAPAFAANRTIKIGYVSPKTGPLSAFGEINDYILTLVRENLKNGLKIGGKNYPVEIIVKDTQSNPNRAAEVANELILENNIDLMLAASTPETTNPVSDQCEINDVPCITSLTPWQPWFFGRGGKPGEGFKYTYHFFWGLEDIIGTYTALWNSVSSNRKVGALFPNDGDGNAWGDPKLGFPPALEKLKFSLLDPGRYQNLTDDFTSYISEFKKNNIEIVTGVMIPPDFTTFWTQAGQQGFRPKMVSVGKALLFPSSVEALGDSAHNLSTEIAWSPSYPYHSSIDGISSRALADGYTKYSGKQWTQPIGFTYALFEVAIDVLKRTADIDDRESILNAIKTTNLDTVGGNISWSKGPVNNVAKVPVVSGQWRLGGKFKYDLVITNNSMAPNIPLGGEPQALS